MDATDSMAYGQSPMHAGYRTYRLFHIINRTNVPEQVLVANNHVNKKKEASYASNQSVKCSIASGSCWFEINT